jgi:hypothetical protein
MRSVLIFLLLAFFVCSIEGWKVRPFDFSLALLPCRSCSPLSHYRTGELNTCGPPVFKGGGSCVGRRVEQATLSPFSKLIPPRPRPTKHRSSCLFVPRPLAPRS